MVQNNFEKFLTGKLMYWSVNCSSTNLCCRVILVWNSLCFAEKGRSE